MHRTLIELLSLSAFILNGALAADNVTCHDNGLDWYTSVNGETPCQTYEKLRQICDQGFTVGALPLLSPPDNCADQVHDCCCNSISFALSMLCLNCQQGVPQGSSGLDAVKGSYQNYIGTCQPNHNSSLGDIQQAVCNVKLKIEDELYTLFWDQGDWYYVYTMESIVRDHQNFNNNTFTHCDSTKIDNSTSSSSSQSSKASTALPATTSGAASPPSSHSSSSLSDGAIVGMVIGVAALFALAGYLLCVRRRRRNRFREKEHKLDLDDGAQPAYEIEPFIVRGSNIPEVPSNGTTSSNKRSQTADAATNDDNQHTQLESIEINEKDGAITASNHIEPSSTVGSQGQGSSASHMEAERHTDAGPLLGRSPSGRLPPAYGDQTEARPVS